MEIDCHGGVYVMKRVLETVIKYGAPAEPESLQNGHFKWTDRSCTGRVCHRYYSCENEFALKSSEQQLSGSLSAAVRKVRENCCMRSHLLSLH